MMSQAWNFYENGTHSDFLDDTLDLKDYVVDDVRKIIEIALMCTQSPTSVRPTMSEVVALLTDDHSIEQKPVGKPTFF